MYGWTLQDGQEDTGQVTIELNPLVHDMASLDPGLMYKEPEACLTKMKSLVHRLIHAKQLAGGITTGDAVIQQYTAFLDEDARDESFNIFR